MAPRASFKVQASIDRNGRLTGQVTYREERSAGAQGLKSTRLDGLIIRGKRAYILGTATLNGQGAYRFVATVTRGGSGKFGLWVLDRRRGTLPDLTFDPASVSAGRTEIA